MLAETLAIPLFGYHVRCVALADANEQDCTTPCDDLDAFEYAIDRMCRAQLASMPHLSIKERWISFDGESTVQVAVAEHAVVIASLDCARSEISAIMLTYSTGPRIPVEFCGDIVMAVDAVYQKFQDVCKRPHIAEVQAADLAILGAREPLMICRCKHYKAACRRQSYRLHIADRRWKRFVRSIKFGYPPPPRIKWRC